MEYIYRPLDSPLSTGSQQLPAPRILRDFFNYLIVENLVDMDSNALWEELGISRNPNILHRRVYEDPHVRLFNTAILVFKDKESLMQVNSQLNCLTICERKVFATPAIDRLNQMVNLEERIVQLTYELSHQRRMLELQGLVSVITTHPTPQRFIQRVFRNCGRVRTIKQYPYDDKKTFYVVAFFDFFSEAYACEVAYNGVQKENQRLIVRSQNPRITIPKLQSLHDNLQSLKEKKENIEAGLGTPPVLEPGTPPPEPVPIASPDDSQESIDVKLSQVSKNHELQCLEGSEHDSEDTIILEMGRDYEETEALEKGDFKESEKE